MTRAAPRPRRRAVPTRALAAAVAVTVAPVALLTLGAAPASATPSPSAVLANTFPVQCQANGASTITGKLTVSAAGPANAAVGDTITVTDYKVSVALDNLPMNTAPFKGATPSFEIDGSFTSHTILSGAMTLGPVASTGPLQRAPLTADGMVTLAGAGTAPLQFTASAPGGVVVTSASPVALDLNWYVVKETPAAGQPLPLGIPEVDPTTPYGTSTVTCTGNPVLPWGTVQVVPASATAGGPNNLAFTGSRTQDLGVAGGWVLVFGVLFAFYGRRRRA